MGKKSGIGWVFVHIQKIGGIVGSGHVGIELILELRTSAVLSKVSGNGNGQWYFGKIEELKGRHIHRKVLDGPLVGPVNVTEIAIPFAAF